MQGIPETSTLMNLMNTLPTGVLGGDLPGNPATTTDPVDPCQKETTTTPSIKDGKTSQNENGIRQGSIKIQRRLTSQFTRFKLGVKNEDSNSQEAQAKLMRKTRMIARLDIVCLILFPIVFVLYAAIYLMTIAL